MFQADLETMVSKSVPCYDQMIVLLVTFTNLTKEYNSIEYKMMEHLYFIMEYRVYSEYFKDSDCCPVSS